VSFSEDDLDELIALAPANGIWCIEPRREVYVLRDRRSSIRVLGTPFFFDRLEAVRHASAKYPPEWLSDIRIEEEMLGLALVPYPVCE
jgi:hypothetical protein